MSKTVKVLEMLPSLNYGGSQTMIVNLVSNMNRDKVACDFIVDHGDMMAMAPLVESLGSKIYVMPTFKGTNVNEIRKAWNDFFIDHPEYKIIHSHSRSYAAIYLDIAKKHGLKTIIHSHNTSNGSGLGSVIKYFTQLPLRKISDYFFACSKEAGKWLFGEKITKQDNYYVINNAINTDNYLFNKDIRNQYRKMFELNDEKVFIQVGRMSKQKNYLFTLDVFSKYLQNDDKAKLFIIGDGELFGTIKNKIDELQINDNVIILQHRDDVNCLLQMADVFLMPSLFEGLSVAAVEAQASGIKVLCSDQVDKNVNITGLCEFIPLNEDEWIKHMSEDLKERTNQKQKIVEAGFDAANNAKWLTDFYKSIV